MSESTTRYDELTEENICTLIEAGASTEFIQLAMHDDGSRNSVRENARRVLEGYVGENSDLEIAFGHFGRAMWEGDMYSAMKRADGRNTKLLLELFGLKYINAHARSQGKDGFKKEDGRVVYR